ncbi:sister chromatid cohesion protein 1 [Coemansia sp. RSA 552]|nr:sister chromatid cohesion protein 1 [Coemansia sp. RSA 552]
MFYAEAILSKKGPLAKVWLAAHLERKLTKNQLLQASIPSSVGAIIGQDQGPPLALRLSGQLLLGVARIYARKARYLLEDCSEALVRIKMAFRPGAADITSDAVVATHNAITLPEALTEFDILLPSPARPLGAGDGAMGAGLGLGAGAALNTSRIQDITLAEEQFDISAVARGAALDGGMALAEEDLLGRDDEFRLDLDADFVLSPPEQQLPEPSLNPDGSALEPEVGRDAMQGFDESMAGIQPEDISLLGKRPGEPAGDGSMMDITREDLGMAEDGGDMLRFGNESDMALPSMLGDTSMAPADTQEAVLQQAEAEVLGTHAGASRPGKRRRLNLSDLVTNEATSLSPNEIRSRLSDPTDIVRDPTYLPAAGAARGEDTSSAAVASRLLALDADSPFAALFSPGVFDPEQQVPDAGPYELPEAERDEPRVPEQDLFEDEFRIEDGGEDLVLGPDPELSAQQLDAEMLPLADRSVEQLERLEEESFQRQVDEQKGIRLFTDAALEHGEAPETTRAGDELEEAAGAAEGPEPTEAADATLFSTSTTRAIHILDEACKANSVAASEGATAAADSDGALSYLDVAKDARRDDAVRLFYELLVLKTKDIVDVAQQAPFEDIRIVPRPRLGEIASSIKAAV